MEEDDKLYRRQYVEGHFSYLDSWLKTNLPEEVLTTTREKIAACNELGITVVRNEEGVLGIEESNLPQGVAYKFQRGHEHSFAKVSMEDFDDEEDSALAIQASGVASNPNVVGEDLGGQMGALLTAGLSHRLRTKSHPPEQQASSNNGAVRQSQLAFYCAAATAYYFFDSGTVTESAASAHLRVQAHSQEKYRAC
jgi:hypothetical protein